MARYIDADKVKTHFDANTWQGEFMIAMCDVTETEDVTPVIHAKWESKLADNGWKDVSCSNCKHTINVDVHCSVDYKYCPYCGAKMEICEE